MPSPPGKCRRKLGSRHPVSPARPLQSISRIFPWPVPKHVPDKLREWVRSGKDTLLDAPSDSLNEQRKYDVNHAVVGLSLYLHERFHFPKDLAEVFAYSTGSNYRIVSFHKEVVFRKVSGMNFRKVSLQVLGSVKVTWELSGLC